MVNLTELNLNWNKVSYNHIFVSQILSICQLKSTYFEFILYHPSPILSAVNSNFCHVT